MIKILLRKKRRERKWAKHSQGYGVSVLQQHQWLNSAAELKAARTKNFISISH